MDGNRKKVTEMCEFDGKELLFVERAMGISKKGWDESSFSDQTNKNQNMVGTKIRTSQVWKKKIRLPDKGKRFQVPIRNSNSTV